MSFFWRIDCCFNIFLVVKAVKGPSLRPASPGVHAGERFQSCTYNICFYRAQNTHTRAHAHTQVRTHARTNARTHYGRTYVVDYLRFRYNKDNNENMTM